MFAQTQTVEHTHERNKKSLNGLITCKCFLSANRIDCDTRTWPRPRFSLRVHTLASDVDEEATPRKRIIWRPRFSLSRKQWNGFWKTRGVDEVMQPHYKKSRSSLDGPRNWALEICRKGGMTSCCSLEEFAHKWYRLHSVNVNRTLFIGVTLIILIYDGKQFVIHSFINNSSFVFLLKERSQQCESATSIAGALPNTRFWIMPHSSTARHHMMPTLSVLSRK